MEPDRQISPTDSSALRVLLVEDDSDQADLIRLYTSDPGAEPLQLDHAGSLEGTLARLARGGVDAVILDLFLPDSRGLDTLVRVHEHAPAVPIVVLTGTQDRETARRAIRMGAQDYLFKGEQLDPDRLSRAVRYAVERAKAESALRQSEERFELLAQATNDGIWDWNIATGEMWWKVGVHSFLGYPAYYAGRDPMWRHERIHEADRGRVISGIRAVIEGGAHFWLDEYRHRCADGSFAWVFDRGYVIRDDQGRPLRMIGALMDITDRKRAEEALRETNETLRTLIQASPVGIALVDASLQLRIWNPAAERILGWRSHEVIGRAFPSTGPGDEFRAHFSRASEGQSTFDVEFRHRKKDGSPVHLSVSMAPLRDSEGRISGAMAVIADASERKLAEKQKTDLEEQLRQSQKMEAVGRLAGGVAHDFNNLLTAISGYGALLLPRFGQGEPQRQHVEEILKSSSMAASLTRQLLAFSRRQVLQPRVLNLNEVLQGMQGLLTRLIGEHIELSIKPDPAIGAVLADQGQIEQVVMNLVVNARDAMPRGGRLMIETRNFDLDEAYAHRHGRIRSGPHVMLAVSDTGAGMDEETLSHLFEPFFTTKDKGKGTGLGLATTYGIVKQSDGDVWVYSEPGRGTSFKIYLPRLPQASSAPPAAPAPPHPTRGTETILLVEDSEFVRRLLKELLLQCGYRVLEASNGREALEVSRAFSDPIHLLLTDVVMPQMGGRELVSRLVPERPATRVLYMSGYTEDAIATHGVLDPGSEFLEKPFTPDGISRKVREVLDAGAIAGKAS